MLKSQKLICSFILLGSFACQLGISSSAYINETVAETYIINQEFEAMEEGHITNESIRKFNSYIASLDKETAKLILDDEELVASMKLDTYWMDSYDSVEIQSIQSVTLPLESWPVGSYFTYDRKACTCHNTCSTSCNLSKCIINKHSCTYDIPSGFSALRCYNAHTNLSGNCRRYKTTGAIQCKGFADYVFKKYTGNECNDYTSIKKGLTSVTEASIKKYFTDNKITVGSHLRGKLKSGGTNHSIIITSISSVGISYYQTNVGGCCLVSTGSKKWNELADWFSSISNTWKA